MDQEPFVIEKLFHSPVAKVWRAITDKDEMKKWYFDLDSFKAEKGFEFRFTADTPDGPSYTHICKVTEVVPLRKLSYTWRYLDYEGNSELTFELFPDEENTLLRLTHAGLETFPDQPNFQKESFANGWTYIITKSLAEYLEGK